MPKYIQVGNDVVEFPDGMSDAQIEQVLVGEPAVAPPSSGFMMGLKDPITGGAQLLPRALAGVTSLGGIAPNPVSQFFSSEAKRVDEMARAEEQAYQSQRQAEGSSGFDFARLAGNIINPASVTPTARAAQLAKARGLAPLGQAAVAGAVGGAMQPATGEGEFGGQKTEQVVLGAVAGPIGEKVVGGAGRMLNPLVSKAEKTMRELGIVPTTGQTIGGATKAFEEFAQNLPLVGGSILGARQRVLFNFNKANINKALDKVDEKLPDDVIGRDAIAYASDQVSKQYDNVLAKMSFDLNFATTTNVLSVINKNTRLSPNQRQEVTQTFNDMVMGKFAGQKIVDGATFKSVESDLRKKASDYATGGTANEREIGGALSDVLGVLKKELYSQNPTQTPKLRRVDSAYGDLAVLNIAAANSGAANGVFTPKQLSIAVRQADQTRRKTAFAKGRARGQEESDAALSVLGDISASTLEGRLATYAMGGIGLFSQPIAIPFTLGAKTLYSPKGQALMDAALRSRPEIVKQAGGLLTQGAPVLGGVIGPSAVGQYNRSERTR
jgi:hypothetical protein